MRYPAAILLLLTASSLYAQRDEQLWLDWQLSYPFGNRYLLENTTSYQTLLNKDGKWRSFALSPTFEYTLLTRLDLTSEITVGYTDQTEDASSFEIAPMVGGRFHISQNNKVDARLLLRYQVRGFRQLEEEDWEVSNRTRLRGEVYWSLNRPNLFNDKLWYLFADYEEFIVVDQQVEERYANRRRGRVGLAYRLSYQHRFDLSFTRQSARNEIDEEFISNDNIIQLRYKLYLNPAKPPQTP